MELSIHDFDCVSQLIPTGPSEGGEPQVNRWSYPSPPEPPKEWEKAEDVAMHFSDLIMRIRTFALPFIAAAIGAGAGLGTAASRIQSSWVVTGPLSFCAAGAFVVLGFLLYNRPAEHQRLRVTFWEFALLVSIGASFAMWGFFIIVKQPTSFLLSAPVLVLGGLLLVPIYMLDRFYYTGLLVGAVLRLEKLENSLGNRVNLSNEISFVVPAWTYTLLPMAMYLFPIAVLLNVGLATVAFGGTPVPCPVVEPRHLSERAATASHCRTAPRSPHSIRPHSGMIEP